jgi:hypothetical protein
VRNRYSDHRTQSLVVKGTKPLQNRYVGDVGDFGKYALLRRLCGPPGGQSIRLAVVWCAFPDEAHNNDGRHIAYLHRGDYEGLDTELLLAIRKLVAGGSRNISSIRGAGILARDTVFYEAPISTRKQEALAINRLRHRAAWLEKCLAATRDCPFVFFDPDNGLEVASVPKHHPKAGKYIYWEELAAFWSRGQTLLIYHHLNRSAPVDQQVVLLKTQFQHRFEGAFVRPLVFRRGSCRVFWLVHRGGTFGRALESRAIEMLCGDWSKHFRPFGWPSEGQAVADAR